MDFEKTVEKFCDNYCKYPYTCAEEDYSDLTFGDRLRAVRRARGMTCQVLADKAGIGSSTIGFYEKRGVLPNVSTLELICKALSISATDLLGF